MFFAKELLDQVGSSIAGRGSGCCWALSVSSLAGARLTWHLWASH